MNIFDHFAYSFVYSLALFYAFFLLLFHSAAASLLRGSSGLGSAIKLWIDKSTDFIWRAGDQFFLRISKQILPKLSILKQIYRYWGGRFWYRRSPWEETWGNHQVEGVQLWSDLRHSRFREDLDRCLNTVDVNEEVFIVVGIRLECDAGYWITLNGLSLLYYSWTWTLHFVDCYFN